MQLIFKAEDILQRGRGLTFDDVLLVPQHGRITSRRRPSLTSQLTRRWTLDLPLLSANMDTITDWEMACAMAELGGGGVLHRFMPPEQQAERIRRIKEHHGEEKLATPVIASVGVKEEGRRRARVLADAGVDILALDIAHGDSVMMLEMLEFVKKHHPQVDVIAGNVATAEGTRRLIDAGADAIKCGIGPGSMCTTRTITGHGVAQLTAIALCAGEAAADSVPVIADGGLRSSGDVVKALCAGAKTAMLGGALSGTSETPGEILNGRKLYRGMASKSAQVSWRGEMLEGMAAEGEATMVPHRGPVRHIISDLAGGLRSGMSYLGVDKIGDMLAAARFMEISASGRYESLPHGLSSLSSGP